MSLTNIFDLQENGYVCFSFLDPLPRDILVETLDIQYDAADNYRYKGIVLNDEGYSIGELILNRLPQGFSGDFRFHDQAYEIIHFKEDLNLFLKREMPEGYSEILCGMNTEREEGGIISNNTKSSCSDPLPGSLPVFCEEKSPTCYASPKILFLVTPESETYIGTNNLELYLTNLVERTNIALQRCSTNVTVHFTFETNFDWEKQDTLFPSVDVDHLADDLDAQTLRDQHEADLVVLLTDPYQPNQVGGGGAVSEIGVNCYRAYAIVVPQKTGYPLYLFPHEIGHLLGGYHHNDIRQTAQHCARGYEVIEDGLYTILSGTADFPRILQYSNPDATYSNVNNTYPTGQYRDDDPNNENSFLTTDMAGRIDHVSCEVADYKHDKDMVVRINGNSTICNSAQTYTADVLSANNGVLYSWSYSFDGVNTTSLSYNTSTISFTPPSNVQPCQTFFLHTTVANGAGVQGKYTKKIKRLSSNCTLCSGSNNLLDINTDKTDYSESVLGINIYPNPNKGSFVLNYESEKSDEVVISLQDSQGKRIYYRKGYIHKGLNTFNLNLNINEGVYFLSISDQINTFSKLISIQK